MGEDLADGDQQEEGGDDPNRPSFAWGGCLAELANALDCSPFHLARIFRAATGTGLRECLRRLRCRLAVDRLRGASDDLTDLALDLGFYDHSHFTNAFSRGWGMPPSRLLASARRQA